jgi:hypothetical protein
LPNYAGYIIIVRASRKERVMSTAKWLIPAIAAAISFSNAVVNAGELHDAVKKGDIEKVKSLVTKENVNEKDDQGATPLIWASAYGKKDILEVLIEKGADINATLKDGTGALHIAARYGEKNVCEDLIRLGAKIDLPARGYFDRTALFIALMNDQTECARLLINKGANVNLVDKSGMVPNTPLSCAAWKKQKEIVKLLLEKGAKDPWLSGVPGFDPLSLDPITPQLDTDGNVCVGSLPLFLGHGFAERPWKLPVESDFNRTGTNLYRWAHPDKEKGPLTIMLFEDERRNPTLVRVVPTIFVGDKGILYSEGQTTVEKGGPFVELIVDTGDITVEKINIVRPNVKPIELNTKIEGRWETTLQSVSEYEPLTITIAAAKGESPITVDVDCCYRSAKKGMVIYQVEALRSKK